MDLLFNVEDELARIYRDLPSDQLRSILEKGDLSLDAATVVRKELARRGEPMPPPLPFGSAESEPGVAQARSAWMWLIIFLAAFAIMCLFGTTARNQSDRGFLWGVIFLQALLLTGCVAGFASFTRSASAIGVIVRIVMLLVLGILVAGLSMCAFFVRDGWGGG